MAMQVGGEGRAVRPTINVTPLVDVVLVLLIIFMVVTPLMLKQFQVNVPKKDDTAQPPAANAAEPEPPLVLSVSADGKIHVNKDEVPDAELSDRLKRVFAARRDHVMFFDADADVPYARAAQVLDLARGGHAVTIAVLTDPLPR